MSASKRKGTAAESAVVDFLRTSGFSQAERRTLGGAKDRGDIAGIPGVVIEVKNCARQELPAWVAEAETERDNDRATLGVVWHKRRGTTDPGRWFVTMSGQQFAALLREQQGLPAPAAETRPARTPCSVPECDADGTGEPCTRHEREDSHAEGDHELCGPECAIAEGGEAA
ncbi:hypothetical protein [Streptomyces sp. GB4-14]|uniref:hypothetical protein n=1 Tax=Streptomyces sp. GB4-14 TaxID=2498703 RepID=UPI001F5F8DB1